MQSESCCSRSGLHAAFGAAVSLLQSAKVTKLSRIGLQKFLQRRLAKWSANGGRRRKARLFWGDEMTVVLCDIPSETLYTYGLFDPDVTEMVMYAVEEGACVIDAGAHFGYVSLLSAQLAGDAGRVVSVEPTPSTFAVLKENVSGRPNMMAIQSALGARNGRAVLQDYGRRYAAFNTVAGSPRPTGTRRKLTATPVEVEVVTVDGLTNTLSLCPSFIKVDTENYEDKVVAGMQSTLRQFRPMVLLEMGSPQSLHAAESIVSHGYRPYVRYSFGRIGPWSGALANVNDRFQDVLFMPQSR